MHILVTFPIVRTQRSAKPTIRVGNGVRGVRRSAVIVVIILLSAVVLLMDKCGEKKWWGKERRCHEYCGGILEDGNSWGCGAWDFDKSLQGG